MPGDFFASPVLNIAAPWVTVYVQWELLLDCSFQLIRNANWVTLYVSLSCDRAVTHLWSMGLRSFGPARSVHCWQRRIIKTRWLKGFITHITSKVQGWDFCSQNVKEKHFNDQVGLFDIWRNVEPNATLAKKASKSDPLTTPCSLFSITEEDRVVVWLVGD